MFYKFFLLLKAYVDAFSKISCVFSFIYFTKNKCLKYTRVSIKNFVVIDFLGPVSDSLKNRLL